MTVLTRKWKPEKIMAITTTFELANHFPRATIVSGKIMEQLFLIQKSQGKSKPFLRKHPTQKAMEEFVTLFLQFIDACRNDNMFGFPENIRVTIRYKPRENWEREEDLVEALLRKYVEFNPETTAQLQLYWAMQDSGLIRQLFMKAFPPG